MVRKELHTINSLSVFTTTWSASETSEATTSAPLLVEATCAWSFWPTFASTIATCKSHTIHFQYAWWNLTSARRNWSTWESSKMVWHFIDKLTITFTASVTAAIITLGSTTWSVHASTSLVWCKLATLNGFTIWTSYIGRFISFFAKYDIELNDFFIANRSYGLLWIVVHDGSLMNEHILLCVMTIDETISAFHIEPLNGARNFFSYNNQLIKQNEINTLEFSGRDSKEIKI